MLTTTLTAARYQWCAGIWPSSVHERWESTPAQATYKRGAETYTGPGPSLSSSAPWRLVKLDVVALAVFESCHTSPVVLGDLGGELHALLLEAAHRLI